MMSPRARPVAAVAVLTLLAVIAVGGAAGATDIGPAADSPATTADGSVAVSEADSLVGANRSAFVVAVAADGDATVTLRLTYDLTDADEAAAFERIDGDAANATARFRDRLSAVAARTVDATGREMRVSDAEATVSTAADVGTIRLTASWSNLAAVDGHRLTVAEPFASDFRPDRAFVLVGPDGYAVANASVPAAATTDAGAAWEPGTDLTGFSATFAPTANSTAGSLPTPLAPTLALIAVGALGYAGWRRR
ncbi:hypothetical protein DVK05_12245 [Halorubrum sp. Atlit-8R]|nr:hypothetical protein DVK08_12315 [Halorubrum sp. Atlit-9R]RLM77648.1 hypothetical protein DVK05_12245 [Halorubrum sp. Atlit-8R]